MVRYEYTVITAVSPASLYYPHPYFIRNYLGKNPRSPYYPHRHLHLFFHTIRRIFFSYRPINAAKNPVYDDG